MNTCRAMKKLFRGKQLSISIIIIKKNMLRKEDNVKYAFVSN